MNAKDEGVTSSSGAPAAASADVAAARPVKRDCGGMAFPTVDKGTTYENRDGGHDTFFEGSVGMTLRDYFAAKAMQTLLGTHQRQLSDVQSAVDLVRAAFSIADAMLAYRSLP